MTYLQLRQEVVDRMNIHATLPDDTPYPFTKQQIKDYMNEGYNLFLTLTKILTKSKIITQSDGLYTVDKGISKIEGIKYNEKELERHTPQEMDALGRENWRTETGTPKYAIMENTDTDADDIKFSIYPKPTAYDEDLRIIYIPALELDTDGNSTILPKLADYALISYTIYKLYTQLGVEQNNQLAQKHFQEFMFFVKVFGVNNYWSKYEIMDNRQGD